MKIRVLPLLILLCAGLGLRPAAGAAAVSFSAGININAAADFYSPLQPYGTWVDVASHGRCFRPTHVEAGWRPYTMGHWEYTDVGWYWVSDEPFGWATFHYGSWVEDPTYGWVWLPGTEWSPAWVTWRESDSYIGWAPCGPNLAVAAPSLFVFVGVGHFCDSIRPSAVIVNNTTVINNTRVVNNFRSESRSFNGGQHRMRVNAGPDVQRVQHATGRNLNATPISTAVERTNARRSNDQPTQQRSTTTQQQSGRERSVTTPEKPAVQEPSGATHQPPTPSTPAPSTPREEHRTATPPQAPQSHERAPAHAQGPEHAAPAAHPAPHGPPVQQDRGNGNDRRHDQP